MKPIQVLFRLLLIGCALHWLSAGCSRGTDKALNPLSDCRIQRTISTSQSLGTVGTTKTDYIYDAQGNLVNKTRTSEVTSSSNVSDRTTTTDTYLYDAASFLTSSSSDLHQLNNFFGKRSEYHSVSTKTYSYSNERLSGYTQTDVIFDSNITSGPQQRTFVTTSSFTYDAAGQLVKQTGGNGGSTTYQNGKAVTFTSPYAFELQDGLVVKATFPGTDASGASRTLVQVNQYDDQRRLINHEEYINGQLDSYYIQEWQAGQPAEASLPTFKGHPLILATYGKLGLLLGYRAYSANKQHQMVQYLEQRYDNQLNAQEFVTGTKQTNQLLTNGAQPPSITTTSYTYTGCN